MKIILAAAIVILFASPAPTVCAQRVVEPNDLMISPAKYRNSSIVIRDVFYHRRAGIPPALTAAGYTLDKYIVFGLRESGVPCFLRRTAENEKLVAGFKNGDPLTVRGTVRQPKAQPARGRGGAGRKLDIYLVEANQVTPGWE